MQCDLWWFCDFNDFPMNFNNWLVLWRSAQCNCVYLVFRVTCGAFRWFDTVHVDLYVEYNRRYVLVCMYVSMWKSVWFDIIMRTVRIVSILYVCSVCMCAPWMLFGFTYVFVGVPDRRTIALDIFQHMIQQNACALKTKKQRHRAHTHTHTSYRPI